MEETTSAKWRCRCNKPCINCPVHLDERATLARRTRKEQTQNDKVLAIYGVDRPLSSTKERRHTGDELKHSPDLPETVSGMSDLHNELNESHRIKFNLSRSGLAAKPPHLVKAVAPT